MVNYFLKIASIVTSIQSDTIIKALDCERFSSFRTKFCPSSVVVSFIHLQEKIIPNNLANPNANLSHTNYVLVSQVINNLDFASSPIHTDTVKQFLINHSLLGDNLILEINENSTVVFDFLNHKITLFYNDITRLNIHEGTIGNTFFSSFLHDYNALMIHCSSVNFDGKAAVFVAMDEGGKTTAATLCKGGNVLSDDQILFKKNDNNEWLAYGTPWTTFEPNPGSATPKAFFLLEKSDEFSLTKLSSRELLAHLWHEHEKARIMIPKMYHTKILDLYISLSSSAPVYLMKFPKDYIDQEAILKCLDH